MAYRTLLLIGIAVCFTVILVAEEHNAAQPTSQGSSYLFVWADALHQSTDFLAVIVADPSSPNYTRIVSSVPVGRSQHR